MLCLLQPVADLGQAGLSAGFILLATRSTADADSGDRLIADLDRQTAHCRRQLAIEDRRIEAASGHPLGEIVGRHSQRRRRLCFPACALSAQGTCTIANDQELGQVSTIGDGNRHVAALSLAGGDGRPSRFDGQRGGKKLVGYGL
jgi:hypothetical protein